MFGHEEMVAEYPRRCRIRAMTNCTVIYINKEDMDVCFPKQKFDQLCANMRNLELDYLVAKISRYYKEKSDKNKAILDATQTNHENFAGRKMQLMKHGEQSKVNRLQPWLQKARVNKTQNQNIMHELRKVKLLSSKEEKYHVSKDDQRQGNSDDSEDGERDYT